MSVEPHIKICEAFLSSVIASNEVKEYVRRMSVKYGKETYNKLEHLDYVEYLKKMLERGKKKLKILEVEEKKFGEKALALKIREEKALSLKNKNKIHDGQAEACRFWKNKLFREKYGSVCDWKSFEVITWLRKIFGKTDIENILEQFVENTITGSQLGDLTVSDLQAIEFGLSKKNATFIVGEIQKLKVKKS